MSSIYLKKIGKIGINQTIYFFCHRRKASDSVAIRYYKTKFSNQILLRILFFFISEIPEFEIL